MCDPGKGPLWGFQGRIRVRPRHGRDFVSSLIIPVAPMEQATAEWDRANGPPLAVGELTTLVPDLPITCYAGLVVSQTHVFLLNME
jgi:hypothetical protein